jgi:hypothetical protein
VAKKLRYRSRIVIAKVIMKADSKDSNFQDALYLLGKAISSAINTIMGKFGSAIDITYEMEEFIKSRDAEVEDG